MMSSPTDPASTSRASSLSPVSLIRTLASASEAIADLDEQIERLASTESLLSRDGAASTLPDEATESPLGPVPYFSVEAIDQLAKDLGSHRLR